MTSSRLAQSAWVAVAVAIVVSGCNGECSDDDDCPQGEVCNGFGGSDGEGPTCDPRCASDADCPEGMRCVDGGNSCEGCEDLVQVCK